MQRVLICASTASHINNFHLPYLNYFNGQGVEVHIAVPDPENLKIDCFSHRVPMAKSFLSPKNISAIMVLREIMLDTYFDLVFTHASLAGALGRISLLLAGKGSTKVICTVHGYLFWDGCGILKKAMYYIPELLLKGLTDCIITMNNEDALTAQKLVKRGGLVAKVPGMGVDAGRFFPFSAEEKKKARLELAIPNDAFVLVYPAEFSKRKNHAELILAMETIVKTVPETLLLLCGTGSLKDEIESLSKRMNISGNVRFLGWCGRMEEIYKASDMAVSTSKSEGLPFNIVEAQMCALPVVASKIRGHSDLIDDGKNGLLYPSADTAALANTVISIFRNPEYAEILGREARLSSMSFSLEEAFKENIEVYKKYLPALTQSH